MKNEIEVTGKTVDDAIGKGLEKLGIDKKDAEIKILDEGKSGLFGLMGFSPARIKFRLRMGHPHRQKTMKKQTKLALSHKNSTRTLLPLIMPLYQKMP